MFYFLLFILGLVFGSFINAWVWRLHVGKSVFKGYSICPRCQTRLLIWDLFPVLSFLFLKGKCRHCFQPISRQYPLVELATALVFVLVYYLNTVSGLNWLVLIRDLLIVVFLIAIFTIDYRYYLIPDKITLPAIIIVLVFNLVLGLNFLNMVIAAVVAGGFFLVQFLISQGQWLGGGDIRLGVLMGVVLGWPLVLVGLFWGYVLGAIVGLILINFNKKTFKSQVPFGTFLTVATFVTIYWGEWILKWYMGLF
ncbi:MAG TPA: prepilin peptidase [Patescibacteria group bacterium]